ncbi:hypothetical protein [Kitasatospora sp. NPDC050463]|uniref:hypothetical protein n=1 Tax=Kitasatospora sp. NPDC050463 TaxID=3155786 RepID=UPI0033C04748
MYDTVSVALEQPDIGRVFERVACWALEGRYPGLRPTTVNGTGHAASRLRQFRGAQRLVQVDRLMHEGAHHPGAVAGRVGLLGELEAEEVVLLRRSSSRCC